MSALPKQPLNIDFSKGVNLKVDPYQVPVGNFLSLVNSVFDKIGRLTKRFGFASITSLPSGSNASYLTTFNGELQAIGSELSAYLPNTMAWAEKGSTYPIELSVLPLVRNALNQSQADSAIAANGLVCTVYTESTGAAISYKYVVADSETGQNLIEPSVIPVASGVVTNAPRVFLLGPNFIIVFGNVITGTTHLQYVAISTLTGLVTKANTDISTSFTASTTLNFDGVVNNGKLFLAWNGAAASGVKMASLNTALSLSTSTNPDPTHEATLMSVCVDNSNPSNPVIWAAYYNSGSTNGYVLAVDSILTPVLVPTQFITGLTITNLTSVAQSGTINTFYETDNAYSYNSSIKSHFVSTRGITVGGVVHAAVVSARSIGLASKAFIVDSLEYYLGVYSSPYQSTYFLIKGSTSTSAAPITIAKLAYQNAGGYLVTGLPNVTVNDTVAQITYLIKDLIQSVNKNTNVPTGSQVAGIYSQTGINLVSFDFTTDGLTSVEIGNDLHLTGGFLWMYDGHLPVEHNFFLYPDSVEAASSATSGSMDPGDYFYQVTYEWSDNQGNSFKSAPSIPVKVTLTSDTSVDLDIPTLRLTYKITSPVKIVIYRWSTAQQAYYQVTSITTPQINSTTIDSISYNDGASDASILGNNLIYTTGGVIEDIGAPASSILSLFDTRLWLVSAEDDSLWFSKQVISGTPVEMSDLFTKYISPSIGAQGPTGKTKATFPMDDKLIIFKRDAIYYIAGTGPDNVGNNDQYTQPTFITSTVGCSNPKSIVMMPLGLMFQSDKGIWLLGRDLTTRYIGAEVEDFNDFQVTSAQAIPGTNQVRFSLDNGIVLMYDYYVNQWGEFQGIPSVSSTLFQNSHTIINQYGQVLQETPDTYLDGSRPVLMSFTTSWLQLAALRGYQRAYWFYILGTYLSPHKLQVGVAYDYNSSITQSNLFSPLNTVQAYGDAEFYGGDGSSPYGGTGDIEQFRFFFDRQRCKSFQLSISEVFDPSFGTIAGPGLTISGLNVIAAYKKSYAPIPQNQQIG